MEVRSGGSRRSKLGAVEVPAESLGEFDVLHDRDVGESAERGEHGASEEDRLVSVEEAEAASPPTNDRRGPAERGIVSAEILVESAAEHDGIEHGGYDGVEMSGQQLGVGVREDQNVTSGGGGTRIELSAAAGSRAVDDMCAGGRAASIDQSPFLFWTRHPQR